MPDRPKTAPQRKDRGNAGQVLERAPDASSNDVFSGGTLRVTIINAEKYTGASKIVFGKAGEHISRVQIYSLEEKLGDSVVNHGGVDEDFKWAGYDDDFKLMNITSSPIVRFVIYDCERKNDRQPLGLALVSLQDVLPASSEESFKISVPIQTRSDVDAFDPNAISIVGSITFGLYYVPYEVVTLEQFADHDIDSSSMGALRFGFGWSSSEDTLMGGFTASLVMFDEKGRFIDAVDDLHPRTKRGPRALYRWIPDKGRDAYTDVCGIQLQLNNSPKLDKMFAAFVVISARTPGSSLHSLNGDIYMRIVDGRNNRENCRFTVGINEMSSSCIMARIVKDVRNPDSRQRWLVKAYGQLAFSERSYGALIPEMRDLLGDVVRRCKGSGKDIIHYAQADSRVSLTSLLAVDLSAPTEEGEVKPSEVNGEGGEEGTDMAMAAPIIPQDCTGISIGFNWTQKLEKITEIDIGCLLLDNDRSVIDSISVDKSRSSCGSLFHVAIDEEEEGIDVNSLDNKIVQLSLAEVPENVTLIAFYVLNMNIGGSLRGIGELSAHLYETESKREVIMLDCSDEIYSHFPTLLVCILRRNEGQWEFIHSAKPSKVPDLLENGVQLEEYLHTI